MFNAYVLLTPFISSPVCAEEKETGAFMSLGCLHWIPQISSLAGPDSSAPCIQLLV